MKRKFVWRCETSGCYLEWLTVPFVPVVHKGKLFSFIAFGYKKFSDYGEKFQIQPTFSFSKQLFSYYFQK